MTPRDKAEQLFDLFDRIPRYAKRAVDEIIQAIRYTDAKSDLGYVGYWNQVKQEIEKL